MVMNNNSSYIFGSSFIITCLVLTFTVCRTDTSSKKVHSWLLGNRFVSPNVGSPQSLLKSSPHCAVDESMNAPSKEWFEAISQYSSYFVTQERRLRHPDILRPYLCEEFCLSARSGQVEEPYIPIGISYGEDSASFGACMFTNTEIKYWGRLRIESAYYTGRFEEPEVGDLFIIKLDQSFDATISEETACFGFVGGTEDLPIKDYTTFDELERVYGQKWRAATHPRMKSKILCRPDRGILVYQCIKNEGLRRFIFNKNTRIGFRFGAKEAEYFGLLAFGVFVKEDRTGTRYSKCQFGLPDRSTRAKGKSLKFHSVRVKAVNIEEAIERWNKL